VSQGAMSCPHCDRGARAGAPTPTCGHCGKPVAVCGGFQVGDEVGRGGVAIVRAAKHADGRDAVIKVLERTAFNPWQVHQLFARSARLAQGFTHEGLPRILGFERRGDRSFLAMERLDGGTLSDRVVAGTRVQGAAFEELLRRLLEAAAYLHERSIVHGDLTPRNVMFRTTRDSSPVLIDLDGLCSPSERGLPSLVMTPGYTAPEHKVGEVSVQSDLYGIGATMIYASTGRSPDSFLRGGSTLDLDVELPGVSRRARALVQRLVDLNPQRRPRSARAALRALRGSDPRLRRLATTLLAAAVILAVFVTLAMATQASTIR
jgi:serine/threonine protein kinase, bacterial